MTLGEIKNTTSSVSALFLNSKKGSLTIAASFGEGISFLMGYSKTIQCIGGVTRSIIASAPYLV